MQPVGDLRWHDTHEFAKPKAYMCGYCGLNVSCERGYIYKDSHFKYFAMVCICPSCSKATYFNGDEQTPQPPFGEPMKHLPALVESLYAEMRNCMQVSAYTASALIARKLLMNISVSLGADGDKSFAYYVKWLTENGYVPPRAISWIDHLRLKGNEATHEVEAISQEDARNLTTFTSMILKLVFEYPAMIPQSKPS